MARRKQRVSKSPSDTDEAPRSTKLEEAWSSAPTRNPRYVLYCTNHENDRVWVVNSYGCYAIRKIFDALIEGQEVEPSPLDPDRTMTFGDIDIKSDQMDKILAHVYTPAEEEWELPRPYPDNIAAFLSGGRITKALQGETTKVTKEGKVERVPKEPKKPSIDRSKFITVQSLAEEEGIDPRDARAALRKAKVEKPEGGWLGDEAWAKGIRTILQAAKKALDKKGKK